MENLVVKGQITATSKKNDGEFSQEVPTKTAYFKPASEKDAKDLQAFGLTQYTSQEGENYFIIKFPAVVRVYLPNGLATKRPDVSQITHEGMETNNFMTVEGKDLQFNIIKSNHKNNDFFRLQAIRLEEESDLTELKPENPFGDKQAF